ncbi:DUF4296 domain-containing protein [Gillisia sp. M10.2A]|uniref:DUF4296 domain-containing protein n=1 Tax=Gillisia lutea TaxID=2909668 RepID=A0ABS9EBL4_9FLAO|nr:DUF4296 domain-containing protein [Gillisia lutea]MCF4100279.1 DUF4296 domain-containing protein [Gillisia lutea]
MRSIWVLFIAVFFISCQDVEEIKKPANLIPEDKMVDVLTDLSILNSAKNYNRSLLEETGIQPDKYLFEKYQIDSLQLAESTGYYAKKYDILDDIYAKVKVNLETKKEEYETLRDEERKKDDSIRALKTTKDTLVKDDFSADSTIIERRLPQPMRRDIQIE